MLCTGALVRNKVKSLAPRILGAGGMVIVQNQVILKVKSLV